MLSSINLRHHIRRLTTDVETLWSFGIKGSLIKHRRWRIMVLQLVCSCGWTVPQEHYDKEGRFLKIIRDIHLKTFPDHKCNIKEY